MILRRTFDSLFLNGLRCNLASAIQFYSVFPPHYIKPTFKKIEQQELYKNTNAEILAHSSIKPACSSDTCSTFHDSLVRKFTNYLMRKGKKQLARSLVDKTFENIKILQLQKYHNTSPKEREHIILDPKVIFYQADLVIGRVIKKKQDLHKQCEANRAYAHYRWL
ncbi:28S ribosomal protein S7, mitochondrial [Habropoda laboriosa]|uniref:28S ribosomal protein S7, mitochondrial n=1 Tax=Habropoda laboriosa TaxID=597456 RepID=A0A0L7RI41_9HYME|nr:28S ribosomal protein S7, mitochondrial [Habropoda laboriosa]